VPMSIGVVCASVSRAAAGILPVMQAHAQELTIRGVRVAVYGVEDAFSEVDRSSWHSVSPRVFSPLVRRFAYAPGLNRHLAHASHEILHQHGLWLYPSIAVSRWRRRSGRPVVVSTHGMLEPWALANAKLKKDFAAVLFERANLAAADCIQCPEAEAQGIRTFGLKNPIAIIPNGVDLPDPKMRGVRPAWLPDDGRRTLLFLGRLHPKKGIRESLEAWARLRSQNPRLAARWRLVVVGWDDGGHAKGFVEHAQRLGLSDVIFPGPVFGKEKEAVLAHADAFLLASHSEGLPMTVLEAWAHGLPVFMTRECNLAEGFREGAAVEITMDPDGLARTLANGLCQANLQAMGTRGRALVAAHFSWSSIADDLLLVYKWLARKAPKPECVRLD
jgi:glycosyltransferase involved in cell wall biosynthesis